MTAWVMALAERTRPDVPNYAEDVHPSTARAAVLVDDFADLFPVFKGWREHFGGDITTYALSFEEGEDWGTRWTEYGPPFRLDHMEGGWIQVSPDIDAKPKGRPLSAPTLDQDAAPAVEGV
ncbi:hypothetical protein RCO28_12425 [Streptomyces sp. LHD-70]|uniref:hypothetical protein n=1 Tax=Streptomyces sp. LHD-70 TaxID=3072140 RepID=UPI0028103746|nr:hypothetical protein [Streptomyces sp. LHD-70]MDQ8703287.1 hypothetical protein [Streptomyces sp. LHD-70]